MEEIIKENNDIGKPKNLEIKNVDPEIKEKIREFTKRIEARIWETPLANQKPPYFPNYFSRWRKDSLVELKRYIKTLPFEEQQQYYSAFAQQVDQIYLRDFLVKLRQPYFDVIYFENYGVPKNLDLHKVNKKAEHQTEIQQLARQITEWCLQIEVSSDLVERAEEMDLYVCEKREAEIYKDLKVQLAGERKQSYTQKAAQYLRQGATMGLQKLSSMCWNTGVSTAQGNMTYATAFLLFYNFMGTGTIPITMLFPKSKIGYIAGGLIGSYALGYVADNLDIQETSMELADLITAFKSITSNLQEFNEKCEYGIIECLEAKTEEDKKQKQEELKRLFKELLEQSEKFKEQRDQVLKMREIVETELDDDWTMLQSKEEHQNDVELKETANKIFNKDQQQNDLQK